MQTNKTHTPTHGEVNVQGLFATESKERQEKISIKMKRIFWNCDGFKDLLQVEIGQRVRRGDGERRKHEENHSGATCA
jgi:hypothetical protein